MNEKQTQALRYLRDPRGYLETFTKIKGKKGGALVPFVLNNAQLDLFNTLRDHDKIAILKARQLGFSTGVVGYFYHNTITTPGTTTAFIGYNSELTADFLDKVKTFWKSTPEELRPSLQYNSKYEISFPAIDSKIIVLPSTENVGRGYAIQNCLSGAVKVAMADGSWKEIDQLFEGDVVVDGHGKPNKVVAFMEKSTTKQMLMLAVHGCRGSIRLTEDHKVQSMVDGKPKMVPAGELEVGDRIAFPVVNPNFFIPEHDGVDWESFEEEAGYRWSTIERVFSIPSEHVVYDISLERAPYSFLTEAGVVSNCLLSEFAFWQKADEKLASLIACVHGKMVVETTPSEVGTPFHRLWVEDNDWEKKEYGWWWGYTEEEMAALRRNMNDDLKFDREFNLQFDATGRSIFDRDAIKRQQAHRLAVGAEVTLRDGSKWRVKDEDGLRIYKPPEPGGLYVAAADIAEGVTGGNYSVFIIFNRMTGEEVAFYRGHVPPDVFGEWIDKWGRKYNNALMTPEVNNHGLTTLTILKQKMYPNLYFRPAKYDVYSQEQSSRLGWKTTAVTRPILIDDLAKAIREDAIVTHSKELQDEMSVMIYDDRNRPVAPKSFNDDCVFAAGIAIQAFNMFAMGDTSPIELSEEHIPSFH